MKKKDKELLMKDLSARLPYGVKVYDTKGNFNSSHQTLAHINGIVGEAFVTSGMACRTAQIEDLKPYLFPMSSMSEEQEISLMRFVANGIMGENIVYDWYNENHFDYRGLINKGLAIDATGKNIY